jgi:hypothetical protein
MDANRHIGKTREVILEVLAYFLDQHLGIAYSRLFMKLKLLAEIERQVVETHEVRLVLFREGM